MKYAKIMTVVLIVFTAVTLFATVGTVKASGAAASEWTVVQLTSDANRHLQPMASGSRIVWLGANGLTYQVYTQKIGVDVAPALVSLSPSSDCNNPKVSGDRIAWQARIAGFEDIYTKKIGTDNAPVLVSNNALDYNIWPMISGDRIAWYGPSNLLTRKMGTEAYSIQVSDDNPTTDSVRVSGDRIVWAARIGSYDQIFTMKIGSDLKPVQLTTIGDHRAPVVSGDRIVWEGYTGGHWQIFTRKMGMDSSPIQITTIPIDSSGAQVSGDRIVWSNIGMQVFTRKIGVDSQPVELSASDALYPMVSGDRVIWWELIGTAYQLIAKDVGSSDPPVQLTKTGGNQAMVSGEYITWISSVGGVGQVFVAHAALPAKPMATTLKLNTTSKSGVVYGAATTLSGTLLASGKAVSSASVKLQSSTNGTTFSNVQTSVTSTTGAYSFSVKQTRKTWYRIAFLGNAAYLASGPTPSIYLIPKVYLTNAVAPTTVRHNISFTVYNYIKPLHTAGTYPVRIYKYRYVSGVWKSYGYVTAKAYNYSTFTKCVRTISLPYSGKWRIRMYAPADTRHSATWSSGYRYITVT